MGDRREKKIDILGVIYTVKERSEEEDKMLEENDGYCDWTTKEIVVVREASGTLSDLPCYKRKVLRHEIVHAFLCESGLHECSGATDAWAANETMVDWFARQGQKIYEAWKKAGALDERNKTANLNT